MSEAAKPRLLLMGASGRLGQMVLSHWRREARAFDVVGQYRQSLPSAQDLRWSPLEDGPAPLLTHVAAKGPVAALVMLGGVTPSSTGGMAAMDDNARLADRALEAAAAAGIPRVLMASSSAVYGAGSGTPFDEDAPLNPANPYGAAKVAMEARCRARATTDTELCMLRIGNVAGADALLLNVAAHPERAVTVDTFADGRGPIRSYIGPVTLADVLAHLALKAPAPLPGALNIGAPEPIAMESLAEALGHPVERRDAGAAGHQHITLDCQRLAALFPFTEAASHPATMVAQWQEITAP